MSIWGKYCVSSPNDPCYLLPHLVLWLRLQGVSEPCVFTVVSLRIDLFNIQPFRRGLLGRPGGRGEGVSPPGLLALPLGSEGTKASRPRFPRLESGAHGGHLVCWSAD